MTFERLFLFLVLLPLVLWVMFHSHRSLGFNRFLVTASGAVVLLLAFCLPGFVLTRVQGGCQCARRRTGEPIGNGAGPRTRSHLEWYPR